MTFILTFILQKRVFTQTPVGCYFKMNARIIREQLIKNQL